MGKLDIQDGLWQMVCAEVQEWKFSYILPNHSGKPTKIVVPSTLYMGSVLYSPFFCA